MSGEFWAVVQVQPRAEDKARQHLANQGFMPYLPRYRRRVRHARRIEIVLRPLFPGYVFVQLDPTKSRWRSINGTVGVRRVLTDGEVPRRVPERIVREIMAREDGDGVVALLPPSFARGQAVRIIDGPFADCDGLFQEMRDDERVVLLFTLLGREVRTVVPVTAVAAA
ncbi:MAG: transcription termination/antitermination NusG family protein [Stellaceae bacterium]